MFINFGLAFAGLDSFIEFTVSQSLSLSVSLPFILFLSKDCPFSLPIIDLLAHLGACRKMYASFLLMNTS